MKKNLTLSFSLIIALFTSQNLLSQTCSDDIYQWSDVATVFENNGCAVAGCHDAAAGGGGLDLTTYAGFSDGGTKCAGDISVGTTLVDIIETGATCTGGDVGAMNNNIATPVSQADIDALQAWVDSGAFEFCSGVAVSDGSCDPTSTVDALSAPDQTGICTDGSDAPTFTLPTASLPDVQIAIEINGSLSEITDDGTFVTSTINEGDEVCYTAFAFDLAAINALLESANGLCLILDCDMIFEIDGLEAAITQLINGDNDGVAGLNNLTEALTFAGSFGTPIESVQSATSTLSSLNRAIGEFSLGPVCFATSDNICLNVESCAPPEPGVATTDGLCDPASEVDPISLSGQTSVCSNGSDAPTFAPASASLPDVQIAIEINGALVDISDDGTFDTSSLVEGEEVCYTAFAFDLEAINALLVSADGLCAILDCDMIFEIPGLEDAITELINGDNDGVPGLNNLNEALTFAGSFGTPIESVLGATTTLISLNEAIGEFSLGPVCFATSDFVCLPVAVCGPCSGEEAEVTFSVDMSCSGTDARPPVVAGPFNGFSGDGNIMEDPDGDDVWEAVICVVPGTDFEYKYAILDFAEQEDLVDDAQGGATCVGVTDFSGYANRLVTIPAGGGALPTDAYGICGTCASPPISVTFTVDMNCSGVAAGTNVAITGGFNGFCDGCSVMDDSDGDGVWERTYVFPRDETGCYKVNYLYQAPNWGNAEDFLGSLSDFADCDIIDTDNDTFANRGFTICEDTVLEDYWFSCGAPVDPGCDDGDCSNGVETWDGCACVAGTPGEIPECDDMDCSNGVETYDAVNCECVAGTPPVDPGCDDGDCSNGVETWDGCECVPGVAGEIPECDDMDCSNGVETYDEVNCECVAGTPPVDPGCDDGDCSNGVETWDGCECVAGVPGETPECDDMDCTNGVETYDAANCECVAGTPPTCPDGETLNDETCDCETILVCEDPCAPNFEAMGACEDYDMTCNTDCTMGDLEVWDAASCACTIETMVISGCTDPEASNYNENANCDNESCMFDEPCIPPTPGVIDDSSCDYGFIQGKLDASATLVVSETGGSFPHGGMGLTGDQTIRDIFTNDGNVGNEIKPGFVVTKHTYAKDASGNKGDLLVTFAMVKHGAGYWEDSNDWEYIMMPVDPTVDYTVNPNGIFANAAVSGNVHDMNPGCVGCHNGAGGDDQLFSND